MRKTIADSDFKVLCSIAAQEAVMFFENEDNVKRFNSWKRSKNVRSKNPDRGKRPYSGD